MRTSLVILFAVIVGTVVTLDPARWFGGVRGAAASGVIPITMVVWGMPFEDRLFEDLYARGYERLAPVAVDYQRHTDVQAKYNAWHANNTGAEVMRMGVDYYRQFVERGMLEPLDDYIDGPAGLTEEQLAHFPERLLERLRVDGRLYALPADNATYGLYYNREIFDAYNAAHPEDPVSYPSADWTWNDVRETSRKLTGTRESLFGETGRRAAERVQGIDMMVWAWPYFNFLIQAGGREFDDDGTTTLVDSSAGVEALEFMGALVRDGSWRPTFGSDDGTGPMTTFPQGRVAMLYGGSWLVPHFENASPELDFAVVPAPRGRERRILSGATIWGMSVNAREKQAGWRMIRWLSLEDQMAAYWNILRVAPPANLAVVESERFRATTGLPNPGGGYYVQPMPPERFDDRAAWLLETWRPDPATGEAPGHISEGKYLNTLQNEIQAILPVYLAAPDRHDPAALLRRAATAVHRQIDGDRAAAGLPPIPR